VLTFDKAKGAKPAPQQGGQRQRPAAQTQRNGPPAGRFDDDGPDGVPF
jgi:hypothetical protein